ncbi:disulfide oxidoreductase [Mechercharimyces sp. CAU 1602]|uniref:disulfide oxidoreductase n=1 Tax=Mechercharimyces sp. CAU 1602 TaxID=2973933 RepID=UPI0021630FD9|nr:disulfide oxidoreductase [Mechercharimyces sp. CAU 1602]MCS1352631.1 disulfide oxidoreductase [Mechercharimyces sp. CAU 1602]
MKNARLFISTYGIYLAWLIALIAMLGSLYFSEIRGFIPCNLCWYQRILMYPLVLLLGIAAFRDDKQIIRYTLPLSLIGGSISLFHYAEQKIPALAAVAQCSSGVPCDGEYINWLGFITIPFLAFTAFLLISLSLWLGRK